MTIGQPMLVLGLSTLGAVETMAARSQVSYRPKKQKRTALASENSGSELQQVHLEGRTVPARGDSHHDPGAKDREGVFAG